MSGIGKLKGVAFAAGIALSPALFVSSAAAFSQEPVQTAPAQGTPSQSNKAAPVDGGIKYVDPFKDATSSKGTEVTIPGVGSVGTLPKLDFGLELLYGPQNGPADTQPGGMQLDQRAQENDVQIKGSLKHKF
jgi:hypothetical protein